MIKKLCFLICMIMLISGCAKQNPDDHKQDYSIIGEYTCRNDFYDQYKDSPSFNGYFPTISFYEDGMCRFHVYYIGGLANLKGVYKVEEDLITVNLDMKNTIFETPPGENSQNYMDDQYVFKIVDEDNIIIDKDCYVIHADDLFVKTSSEPTPMEPDPEYDILGKYMCSGENFSDTADDPVPYIEFYKEGHCKIYIGLPQEDKYYTDKSGRQYEMEDVAWCQYYFEEDRIHITDIRFFPFLDQVDHHPLLGVMQDHYVCTIIDEDQLVIDKGFYKVNDGDTFVREK